MRSHQNSDSDKLLDDELAKIKAEVKQAAIDHLNTTDAATAISHYTEDVIAISNDKLFPSLETLSEDIKAYYDILKEVNLAVWDKMYINVINTNAALVTAKFRYSFTSINNEETDIQGMWTALYIRLGGDWKIRVRHESFATFEENEIS